MKRPRLIATIAACAAALTLGGLLPGAVAGAGTASQGLPAFTTVPIRTSVPGGGSVSPLPAGPNVNVTHKNGAQSETTIALDSSNARKGLTASNDLTATAIAYQTSDGGRTWTDAGLGLTSFCYDPWLEYNATGDAFYAYECSAGGTQQWIAYRKAGTTNWVKTLLSAGSFPDRDMVAVDTHPGSPGFGRVYVSYDDANQSNAAFVNYSPDGFGNWVKSPKINDTSRTIGNNVTTNSAGIVTAAWEDFDGGKIWSDRSLNGGATWGTDHLLTDLRINTTGFFIFIPPQPQRGVLPMPFMATAPDATTFSGRIYATYMDKAVATADTDVFVRYSDDGGVTWSAEAKVNDDTVDAYQFHPAIDVAPDGTVAVSFYDTRGDLTDKKTDRYVAFSTDGGVTWSTNLKVTTAMSDESGFTDPNDYGDYEGMSAARLASPAFGLVWTDSRPGTLGEDMFVAGARP